MSRRSHLRPPQPIELRQSHRYERVAPVLLFVAAATALLMLSAWASK